MSLGPASSRRFMVVSSPLGRMARTELHIGMSQSRLARPNCGRRLTAATLEIGPGRPADGPWPGAGRFRRCPRPVYDLATALVRCGPRPRGGLGGGTCTQG